MESFIYFADEQAERECYLFGGYVIGKQHLKALDEQVRSLKQKFGIPPDAPVKFSPPPDNPRYDAERQVPVPERQGLFRTILEALEGLDAKVVACYLWKPKGHSDVETYTKGMKYALQRVKILLDRNRYKSGTTYVYPVFDAVVDWLPQSEGHSRDEYFEAYRRSYENKEPFIRNERALPSLRELEACPCLLVSSCTFSPALQAADICVGVVGDFLRWCASDHSDEQDKNRARRVKELFPVMGNLLLRTDSGDPVGAGLVTWVEGTIRCKVYRGLNLLGVNH